MRTRLPGKLTGKMTDPTGCTDNQDMTIKQNPDAV